MADQPSTDNSGLLVVLCTCPEESQGREIATRLVEERLAACVNLIPGLTSVYRWEGHIENAGEVLLMIKTTPERYRELEERLAALHPYEVPEIVALPAAEAHAAYAQWAREACAA